MYLKYWTLNLNPLMVFPKVLYPPNFIINRTKANTLDYCLHRSAALTSWVVAMPFFREVCGIQQQLVLLGT